MVTWLSDNAQTMCRVGRNRVGPMVLLRRRLDRTGMIDSFYNSLSERPIVIETFTNK